MIRAVFQPVTPTATTDLVLIGVLGVFVLAMVYDHYTAPSPEAETTGYLSASKSKSHSREEWGDADG